MSKIDEFRGMDAEDFKKSVDDKKTTKQVSEEDINKQSGVEETPEQKQETATQQQQPETETKDANVDQKDVSVLSNTFNIDYESLPEGAREGVIKMAKSYREAQGKFTSQSQRLREKEKTLENMNSFFNSHPDIYEKVQQRRSGNQPEEGADTPSKPSPSSDGQSATVDKQKLMKEGYLDESDLTGLDELAQDRVVAKAELRYLKDQEIASYRKELENEKKKLSEAERLEKVKQTNAERMDDGIDRVVADYGIDFTNLDDQVVDSIYKRATRILDPNDSTGRTIDKDATYDATLKELAIRGLLPDKQPKMPKKDLNSISDTGVQFNKRGKVAQGKSNTREDIYKQKMQEKKSQIKDTSGFFSPK